MDIFSQVISEYMKREVFICFEKFKITDFFRQVRKSGKIKIHTYQIQTVIAKNLNGESVLYFYNRLVYV